MADGKHVYVKGERVEVRRLSGWKPGTVVGSSRSLAGGRALLIYVLVDGDRFEKPYRDDQLRRLRSEPGAPPGCRCGELEDRVRQLEQENEGLRTQVRLVTGELRKWVDAG